MGTRLYRLLGLLGLVLILAGGIFYGIFYTGGWMTILPLLAGMVLTLVAFVGGYHSEKSEGSRRSARYGIGMGLSVIVAAAILIFLQTLSYRHNYTIDLTSNRRFSLSLQTRKVLDGLNAPVHFTCFFKETSQESVALQDLLDSYSNRNPEVTYIFIDPDKEPIMARNFGIRRTGVIFAESGDTREELEDPTEEKLTNTLARVTAGRTRNVCFITGHGEKSIQETDPFGLSALIEALQLENFEIREITVAGIDRIPEDCDILVFAGPEKDLIKHEQNIILDFLTGGGRGLFLIDPMTDLPNTEGILAAYGIILGNDVIVDRYGKLLAGNFLTPVVNTYGQHAITEGFRHFTFFPQARSVTAMNKPPADLEVTVIGKTNEGAYSESDMSTLLEGQTQYEPAEDLKGPIDIAAVSEMKIVSNHSAEEPDSIAETQTKTADSRVVVFGDSDFAVNSNLRLSGNRDLILNAINWLAEEDDLISVRPVDELQQPVLLTATQGRFVFWIPVVALPALVLLLGTVILTIRMKSNR